jgi:AraC-like DNA-binding protein
MASLITGLDLDLPLLIHTSTVHNHAAEQLPWHSHEGIELVFLLRGATFYEFAGGVTRPLPGGHFLVVPARTQHRGGHELRMPSTLVGLVCDLRPHQPSLAMPLTGDELRWLACRFQKSGAGVYTFSPDLVRILHRLRTEIETWHTHPGNLLHKAVLRTLACATLLEAASQLGQPHQIPPKEIVAAAVDYLRAHLAEPLQMAELVKHLGLCRAWIYELFSAETGLTPHDYRQRLRLEKAQELLRDTRRTVTDIAFTMGFESSQHFSRVFRKYAGETPSDYRERANHESRQYSGAP